MDNNLWLPPHSHTAGGQERRVGVELELAGLEPLQIVQCIRAVFGGDIERRSRFEFRIVETLLGTFSVELDASYLKAIGYRLEKSLVRDEEISLENLATDLLTVAAEQVVPWEIATPPVPLSQLHCLTQLFSELRNAGALGTRSSLVYAFGLHLNPELPALDVGTILNYLRAFLCLYDWLTERDRTDLTRRLTSYINHFNKPYLLRVLDADYRPRLHRFMEEYIQANPTRNRTLDLLPLFAHIDERFVRCRIDDPRVKARPTLHYRLPNCDIDNKQWNLDRPWRDWLEVERLAGDAERLAFMCREYRGYLKTYIPSFDNEWLRATQGWLQQA